MKTGVKKYISRWISYLLTIVMAFECSVMVLAKNSISENSVSENLISVRSLALGNVTDYVVWSGESSDDFAGGSGTKDDPFIISTAEELSFFADSINDGKTYKGKFFILENDIYLNNISDYDNWSSTYAPSNEWDGINGFAGTIDGMGHTIFGLYMNRNEENTGFFNEMNQSSKAEINNLSFEYLYVRGTAYVGGIVGKAGYCSIENCSVNGRVIGSSDRVAGFVGGFFSKGKEGVKICDSVNNAQVSGNNYVAGFIGEASIGNSGGVSGYEKIIIEESINKGMISGTEYVGGILGYWEISLNCGGAYIFRAGNEGAVLGQNYVGGIVGYVTERYSSHGPMTLDEIYNTGNISGDSKVGGIIGSSCPSWDSRIEIEDVYNAGEITATSCAGGVVGRTTSSYGGVTTILNGHNSGEINCAGGAAIIGESYVGSIGAGPSVKKFHYLDGMSENVTQGSKSQVVSFYGYQKSDFTTFSYLDFSSKWEMGKDMPVFRWQSANTNVPVVIEDGEIGIYIYNRATHLGVPNFNIYVDEQEVPFKTDQSGVLKLKVDEGRHAFHLIENEGYETYSHTITECKHKQIYSIGVVPISNKPVLLRAQCEVAGQSYNVLNYSLELEQSDKFNLELVGASTKSTYISRYELWQGDSKKAMSMDGMFTDLAAKDFNVTQKVYVCMIMSDGSVCKTWLGLTVDNSRVLDANNSLKLGDELSVTIDESYPVIGGSNIKFDLGRVPIYCEQSDGKYKIAINLVKAKSNDGVKYFGGDFWEKYVDSIDNNYSVEKYLDDLTENVFSKQRTPFQKLGKQNLNIDVSGYLEGSKDSLKGKIVVKLMAQPDDMETQFAIGPVPMVFVLGVKGEITGSFEVKIKEMNFSQPEMIGGLTPKATISVGVGPGLAKAVYVTANGSGSLQDEMKYNFSDKFLWQEVKLIFRFFAKVKFFFMEAEWPFHEKEVILYSDRTDFENVSSQTEVKNSNVVDINSVYDYSVRERPTDDESTEENEEEQITRQNGNVFSDMQLIETKDVTMLVYLSDNVERASGDGTMLNYSLMNKETGEFETSKAIEDDGTGDFNPVIASDENNIYIAWSEFQNLIGETETVDYKKVAAGSEIKLAIYNLHNHAFKILQVTDNEVMDVYPDLMVSDEGLIVSWVTNKNNNILMNDADSEIKYSVYKNGAFSKETTVVGNISSIEDVVLAKIDGNDCVVYTADKDNDLMTEGNYLNVYFVSGEKMLTLEGVFRDLQYQKHLSNPIVTWNSDGVIKYLEKDLTINSYMPFENRVDGMYRICEDDKCRKVFSLRNMELNAEDVVTTEIACYTDNGEEGWSKFVALTDTNERIADFAIYSHGETKKCVYNQLVLNEEASIQSAQLCLDEFDEFADIAIKELNYKEVVSEQKCNKLVFDVEVENLGSVLFEDCQILIKKSDDEVVGSLLCKEKILQGESAWLEGEIDITGALTEKTDLIFEVKQENDINADNNKSDIVMGIPDLDLDVNAVYEQDGQFFDICVGNNSLNKVADGKLYIYEEGKENNPIEIIELESVDIDRNASVVYNVVYDELEFLDDTKILYFEVKSSEEERFLANNKDFVVLENPETRDKPVQSVPLQGIQLSESCIELELGMEHKLYVDLEPYNATDVEEINWSSSNPEIVRVNPTGELRAIKEGECKIQIQVNDFEKECRVKVVSHETDAEKVIFKVDDKSDKNENADTNTDKSEGSIADKKEESVSSTNENSSYKKGALIKDKSNLAVYRVTKVGKEVEYVKSIQKATRYVVIPADITVDDVKYKVTGIAQNAFKGSKTLRSVVIGRNVKIIGEKAFYSCKKLKTVVVGKSVEKIKNKAFAKCISLKKITIPSKVSQIGKYAFYGCKKLKKIVIETKKLTKKKIGKKAFKGTHPRANVKIPNSKFAKYKKWLILRGVGKKSKFRKIK